MPKIPAITWKDLFRFQINSQKEINGRYIYGPELKLLGLTRDEIPNRHAFLVYIVFKIKYSDNFRILEEEIKIPTICENNNDVQEADDDHINTVEYDCIGNITEYENEEVNFTINELTNIEENPNDNLKVLRNSNLNEIVNEKNVKELVSKNSSTFTLTDYLNTSLFIFDEIKNQTSDNLIFNFSLNGKLNNELNPSKINTNLSIAEIKDKYANCTFEIKENKEANLNCYLNIEDYKDYKTLSFKTATIDYDEKSIFIDSIHEIFLLNNYKESKLDNDNNNDNNNNNNNYNNDNNINDGNDNENNSEDDEKNINILKDKNKNKTLLILLSIFLPIIIIGIAIVIIILIKMKNKKKKKIFKYVNNTTNNEITNNEISKESSKDECADNTNKTDDIDDIDIVPDRIEVGKKVKHFYEK